MADADPDEAADGNETEDRDGNASPEGGDRGDRLAPFDADLVAAVAAETGGSEASLWDALGRHQAYADSLPSVEDLVYEWRTQLPYDPLVARTDEAYYVALLPGVWNEFGEQMGLSGATITRLREVHDRQARRAADERGEPTDAYEGAAPMVLSRE
ncbi:MAG: hypothetical protein ABEI11_00230 [Haloarculaceae archaeon]